MMSSLTSFLTFYSDLSLSLTTFSIQVATVCLHSVSLLPPRSHALSLALTLARYYSISFLPSLSLSLSLTDDLFPRLCRCQSELSYHFCIKIQAGIFLQDYWNTSTGDVQEIQTTDFSFAAYGEKDEERGKRTLKEDDGMEK